MRGLRLRHLAGGAAMALCCLRSPALAQDAGSSPRPSMHRSPHHEETERIVGLKGAYAVEVTRADGRRRALETGGFLLFYEQSLFPDALELEASTGFFVGPRMRFLPVDLLLKKPFHFGVWTPYLAVGPTMSIAWIEASQGEPGADVDDPPGMRASRVRELLLGAAVSAGTYYWLGPRWGLDLDVVYSLLANLTEPEHPVHELVLSTGIVARF